MATPLPDDAPGLIAALLRWQIELGVTEAIAEAPLARYRDPGPPAPGPAPPAVGPPSPSPSPSPSPPAAAVLPAPAATPAADAAALLALARREAAAAADLAALARAMAAFEGLEIRRGARNFVFADGNARARVMVVGEAPGREEDLEGRPFVGRAGRLLDRMFAAIGLARDAADPARALYIANVLPWRPPGNRTPAAAEVALMTPFLERHIDLAGPEVLVIMGNTPAQALLGRSGILGLRGRWTAAAGRPALPMTHPAYLLRNPAAKREAWADLLTLRDRMAGGG
ncbi:MAG: uracil-DNA glycosylase [Rhodobacteraceae bacterium]|nr:uracil-DNA glycosylase [Paracoccaceae bacterium]